MPPYVPILFPAMRYHQKPEGEALKPKIVQDQAASDALGPEWGELPFGAEPHPPRLEYVPSTPSTPTIIEYPGWRYHATLPPQIVNSPDEAARLGPGWQGMPFPSAPTPVAAPAPSSAPQTFDQAQEAKDTADLHKTPVKDVLALIGTLTDVSQLLRIRAREMQNTAKRYAGGRPAVLAALVARIQAQAEQDAKDALAPPPVPTSAIVVPEDVPAFPKTSRLTNDDPAPQPKGKRKKATTLARPKK